MLKTSQPAGSRSGAKGFSIFIFFVVIFVILFLFYFAGEGGRAVDGGAGCRSRSGPRRCRAWGWPYLTGTGRWQRGAFASPSASRGGDTSIASNAARAAVTWT